MARKAKKQQKGSWKKLSKGGHDASQYKREKPMELRNARYLAETLEKSGFFIKRISADGNCLFRAFADQMYGNEDSHMQERTKTVQYLKEHREEFENFIEDDEPFNVYIARMSRPSVWAGNLELQILSMIHKVNLVVHQQNEPTYVISNFSDDAECVQLSFHNVAHYNSVRLLSDNNENTPAKKFTLRSIKKMSGMLANSYDDCHQEEEADRDYEYVEPVELESRDAASATTPSGDTHNREPPKPHCIAVEPHSPLRVNSSLYAKIEEGSRSIFGADDIHAQSSHRRYSHPFYDYKWGCVDTHNEYGDTNKLQQLHSEIDKELNDTHQKFQSSLSRICSTFESSASPASQPLSGGCSSWSRLSYRDQVNKAWNRFRGSINHETLQRGWNSDTAAATAGVTSTNSVNECKSSKSIQTNELKESRISNDKAEIDSKGKHVELSRKQMKRLNAAEKLRNKRLQKEMSKMNKQKQNKQTVDLTSTSNGRKQKSDKLDTSITDLDSMFGRLVQI